MLLSSSNVSFLERITAPKTKMEGYKLHQTITKLLDKATYLFLAASG